MVLLTLAGRETCMIWICYTTFCETFHKKVTIDTGSFIAIGFVVAGIYCVLVSPALPLLSRSLPSCQHTVAGHTVSSRRATSAERLYEYRSI